MASKNKFIKVADLEESFREVLAEPEHERKIAGIKAAHAAEELEVVAHHLDRLNESRGEKTLDDFTAELMEMVPWAMRTPPPGSIVARIDDARGEISREDFIGSLLDPVAEDRFGPYETVKLIAQPAPDVEEPPGEIIYGGSTITAAICKDSDGKWWIHPFGGYDEPKESVAPVNRWHVFGQDGEWEGDATDRGDAVAKARDSGVLHPIGEPQRLIDASEEHDGQASSQDQEEAETGTVPV